MRAVGTLTLAASCLVVALGSTTTPAIASSAGGQDRGPTLEASVIADDVSMLRAVVAEACAVVGLTDHCGLVDVAREQIADDVAEYELELRVGPGTHDRIRLHRVVRETRAGQVNGSPLPVFFVHGDVWGFGPVFAGDLGDKGRTGNVATFLARNLVDVWGIDLRWVLVPAGTTDLGFMADWGFDTDLADLRLATTVERAVRTATGLGDAKTALVGWSRGGEQAYAYASMETQLPEPSRNVSALVPVDILLRYAPADGAYRRGLCERYRASKAELNSGTTGVSYASIIKIGRQALADPAAPSKAIPGLTNLQAGLLVGAGAFGTFNAWEHFVAGKFDSAGTPTALRYTPEPRFLRLLTEAAPWESQGDYVDGEALMCGKDLAFAAHLHDVRVPVLYLAAAGGFGTTGSYTTTLLGSTDITQLIVRLQPVGAESTDFGHVDLWQASNAESLVWTPLLDWLRHH